METQQATFGAGCFWCTEAIFQNLKGVVKSVSGYMGGRLKNPTYMEVCNGDTGHAEVIQIDFDPEVISFEELLLIFFKTHDPTTLNRQGNDVGTQYRSVIFYLDESQKVAAEKMISRLESEKIFDRPIVTGLAEAEEFYEAEDYHHDYYEQNPYQPYCTFVIQPKVDKLMREWKNRVKGF